MGRYVIFTIEHFWTQIAGIPVSALHELLAMAASCLVQITWALNTASSPLGFYLVSLRKCLAVAFHNEWAHHMPATLLGSGSVFGTISWSWPWSLALLRVTLPSTHEQCLSRYADLMPITHSYTVFHHCSVQSLCTSSSLSFHRTIVTSSGDCSNSAMWLSCPISGASPSTANGVISC